MAFGALRLNVRGFDNVFGPEGKLDGERDTNYIMRQKDTS